MRIQNNILGVHVYERARPNVSTYYYGTAPTVL